MPKKAQPTIELCDNEELEDEDLDRDFGMGLDFEDDVAAQMRSADEHEVVLDLTEDDCAVIAEAAAEAEAE